jgi:hypothetical protein
MTKANRIKLGLKWKEILLKNKELPASKKILLPKQVTLNMSTPWPVQKRGSLITP